tara:strand:- start:106 stop:426 length:321 start_codon:yes stop_codon:yes gene_type:complete
MKLSATEKAKLKRFGLSRLNKPKMTPKHKTKKAIVAIRASNGKVRILRFGAQGMGHNYSAAARKSFKARHAKNIAKGKTSPAYWADRFLWAGPGKRSKQPPKKRRS